MLIHFEYLYIYIYIYIYIWNNEIDNDNICERLNDI